MEEIYQARPTIEKMENFQFILMLIFMLKIFRSINLASSTLQSSKSILSIACEQNILYLKISSNNT